MKLNLPGGPGGGSKSVSLTEGVYLHLNYSDLKIRPYVTPAEFRKVATQRDEANAEVMRLQNELAKERIKYAKEWQSHNATTFDVDRGRLNGLFYFAMGMALMFVVGVFLSWNGGGL